MRLPKPIKVGSAHAAVAIYLDADEARLLADSYGYDDLAYREIHDAVDLWEAQAGVVHEVSA